MQSFYHARNLPHYCQLKSPVRHIYLNFKLGFVPQMNILVAPIRQVGFLVALQQCQHKLKTLSEAKNSI